MAKRNWDDPKGNVIVRDGVVSCRAKFSPRADMATIAREYLSTYGYTDLDDEILGKWWEGEIERNGETVRFYVRPDRARTSTLASHTIRFSRPPVGETRYDGYRY